MSNRDRRLEAGDTLVELLIGVVIIAATAAALLGGIVTSITASSEHRSLAADDTLARSYAEFAAYQIEDNAAAPLFVNCDDATNAGAPTGYAAKLAGLWGYPAGYTTGWTVGITGIRYYQVSTHSFVADTPNQCSTTLADQTGVQELTITAVNTQTHVSDGVSIVVRDPTYAGSYGALPW